MSTAIAQFMYEHPDIRIEMDLSDKRVDMIAEGIDAAIRIGALTDSSLIAKNIDGTACTGGLAKPDSAISAPQHPNDLRDWPALIYDNGRTRLTGHTDQPTAKQAAFVSPRV